jgi:hypothetical protein
MAKGISFERLVIDGTLQGPDWPVVDQLGTVIIPGDQDFGHTVPGRWVKQTSDGFRLGAVVDYQHPVDTPIDLRDASVGYDGTAFDPKFR